VASLHVLAAQLVLVLTALGAGWAAVLVLTRRPIGAMLQGLLLWIWLLTTAAAALGVAIAVSSSPPRDPLHAVYGALAVAAVPVMGLAARGRPERRIALVMAIGLIVLLILTFRLFQTGG